MYANFPVLAANNTHVIFLNEKTKRKYLYAFDGEAKCALTPDDMMILYTTPHSPDGVLMVTATEDNDAAKIVAIMFDVSAKKSDSFLFDSDTTTEGVLVALEEKYDLKFKNYGNCGHTWIATCPKTGGSIQLEVFMASTSEDKLVEQIIYYYGELPQAVSLEYVLNNPEKFKKYPKGRGTADAVQDNTLKEFKIDGLLKGGDPFEEVIKSLFGGKAKVVELNPNDLPANIRSMFPMKKDPLQAAADKISDAEFESLIAYPKEQDHQLRRIGQLFEDVVHRGKQMDSLSEEDQTLVKQYGQTLKNIQGKILPKMSPIMNPSFAKVGI